jgi:AcrR family transcriptional regulator
MPRRPQQTRSKATVDAIIEAAFIAVAERGTAATTTRHVAELAGVSVGSLYEYFANKEALFNALGQRFVDETVAMLKPLQQKLVRLPIDEAVYTLLMEFGELLRRNDELYLRCAREAIQSQFQHHLDRFNKALMDLVVQYGLHNPDNFRIRNLPTMAYIFINGGIFAVVRHLSDPNPPMDYEALARGLADMVGHYVKLELAAAG